MPRIIAYSATSRVERNAPRRVRPPPRQTVRAVFPHTAFHAAKPQKASWLPETARTPSRPRRFRRGATSSARSDAIRRTQCTKPSNSSRATARNTIHTPRTRRPSDRETQTPLRNESSPQRINPNKVCFRSTLFRLLLSQYAAISQYAHTFRRRLPRSGRHDRANA